MSLFSKARDPRQEFLDAQKKPEPYKVETPAEAANGMGRIWSQKLLAYYNSETMRWEE